MQITLALSGGGFRATVFHLGVLARLAKENRLEEVKLLSTVSGGSLCIGLIYALSGFKWPDSPTFLEKVEPKAHELLTQFNLEGSLIERALFSFWTLHKTRASTLSALMQKHWGLTAYVDEIPASPRWMINTTCYETGKNWRIERFRMGDYTFGYTKNTHIPLSDAVAASAGFPGLIGAYELKTGGRDWYKYVKEEAQPAAPPDASEDWKTNPIPARYPAVHLWDGGVYDNHGLEGIHDIGEGWGKRFGFLIVSDAAGRSGEAKYQVGIPALMRLATGIMMSQVRSLRTRAIVDRLVHHPQEDQGVFLQMGSSNKELVLGAKNPELLAQYQNGAMSDAEVDAAAQTPTVIRKLSEEEYSRLFHHGYEMADTILTLYYPNQFEYLPYAALDRG
jgi:NTE family protein